VEEYVLFTENAQDWKEVEKRKAHPNVIFFSSLTLQEKIKIMNKWDTSNKEANEVMKTK
jgi:hypothetical protein